MGLGILQVIFQVALTILDTKQEDLLKCNEDGEAMAILCEFLDNIDNSNSTTPNIMHTANASGMAAKEVCFQQHSTRSRTILN